MKKVSMFENYPDVVEVEDLRKMLGGISRKLAYRLLADDEIRSVKVGRTYKIPKACVIEYLLGACSSQWEYGSCLPQKRRKIRSVFSTWNMAIPNTL